LLALLDILNARQRPIMKLKKGFHYHVDRLFYPSDLTRIPEIQVRAPTAAETIFIPAGSLRKLRSSVLNALALAPPPAVGGRLFVIRGQRSRRLLNEPQLMSDLTARGFEIVDLDRLRFDTQVELFWRAEIVVFTGGATVTNLLWCRPGSRVLILTSNHPGNNYDPWRFIAAVSGAEITFVAGSCAGVMDNVHDDFTVDLATVAAALEGSADR
jgi:capsular polysaccharide biosynthesis protein